jgi:hypothetical protein
MYMEFEGHHHVQLRVLVTLAKNIVSGMWTPCILVDAYCLNLVTVSNSKHIWHHIPFVKLNLFTCWTVYRSLVQECVVLPRNIEFYKNNSLKMFVIYCACWYTTIIIQGVSRRGLQWYSKCYCVVSVNEKIYTYRHTNYPLFSILNDG